MKISDWRVPHEWVWVQSVAIVSLAVLVALAAHWLVMRIALRTGRRRTREARAMVLGEIRRPSQWVFVSIAVSFAARTLPMDRDVRELWEQLLGFAVPALLGWSAIAGMRAVQRIVELQSDISVEDNLAARRKRTRATILGRISSFFIIFVTVCLMLLSVPGIRTIGVTLMASAGIAGLVVGAAAQPALKNLIAGVQMAFTEPIRLDDVVIVAGEWGRIEEIRLTFVVIKLWDERRLVVPVSKFLEESFQNWTRETSRLLGSVFWYVDPAADVARIREAVGRAVQASERWDGRFWNCQVTDVKADAVEIRGLMTAKDASISFDLRCEVREAVLAFMRDEMPEAMPRGRILFPEAVASPQQDGRRL
ncbi:mechanosensitive ion channel family protein [Sphingomonas mollis]|uniref:Mechanosensitive ion channel n=1 Tax=Sphingomonas mollis TaxID=2795726 RepID=A0ABS0XSM7_9SPHN|nr:mechanosensitive ion channel domain-containing protein [Sphingomonas sp. BT553]MBJ6123019.1 mechanosensitive ion channel [Sphingomonas sp. BT553]